MVIRSRHTGSVPAPQDKTPRVLFEPGELSYCLRLAVPQVLEGELTGPVFPLLRIPPLLGTRRSKLLTEESNGRRESLGSKPFARILDELNMPVQV